jgi:hypothetical protein
MGAGPTLETLCVSNVPQVMDNNEHNIRIINQIFSQTKAIFSMALTAHSGLWPLIQFRNHFSQTVGLFGRVISPSQGRYLNTGQHKHRINAYTDIHASSGIRAHDPSIRASEDSSCLRPRGYCDRPRPY